MYKKLFLIVVLTVTVIRSEKVVDSHVVTTEKSVEALIDTLNLTTFRKPGSRAASYLRLVNCASSMDLQCFVDSGNIVLELERKDLLVQADAAVLKVTGRGKDDSTPSALVETISQLISELKDLFKDGVTGFFRSGKEGDDDDEVEESAVAKKSGGNKDEGSLGEARKKKKGKIHKLIGLIKLLILGAVLAVKICILLKIFAAHLQAKFLLVALGGLLLNALKFYFDYKKGHNPQKVIYYEHAQHQHHYEGGDEEDWGSDHGNGGGGYWGRAYDEQENGANSAQDLAYAKQKPVKSASWLG